MYNFIVLRAGPNSLAYPGTAYSSSQPTYSLAYPDAAYSSSQPTDENTQSSQRELGF